MDLAILRELGEWAALGFYEAIDAAWPQAYGRAYRRMYEGMPVRLPAAGYLTPFEPMAHARTRDSHGVWAAGGMILDHNHHCGLQVNQAIAEHRKEQFPQHAEFIDTLVTDLRARRQHFGGYTHSNPDIRRVVDEGFHVMEAEMREQLADLQNIPDADPETLSLFLALEDYAAGVNALYRKTLAALNKAAGREKGIRAERLALVADSFAHCFVTPSRTFLQGLLAVNLAWMLDGCDGIGRFDQALGPLFEQDREAGTLDLEFVRDLLDELWQAFERLNGWNLQIGGRRPKDGRDGCNTLTLECIRACERNKIRRPNVAFRVTADTPDDVLVAALKALRRGSGRPVFYNDDLYVKTLYGMYLGLTLEDAMEIGFGGCTETMIAGLSNCGSLEGYLNLAKAFELALNDGFDPVAREQAGPHTGQFADFATYEQFLAAVKRHVQYMTDAFVSQMNAELKRRFHEGDPKLCRTFFTRDCIRRRKSFEAGGARYNWSVVSYQGIANTIDSLVAVKAMVFDRAGVSAEQLKEALDADFEGHEQLRQALQAVPKFGNNNPVVDEVGADITAFAWETLYAHQPPRGGRYLPSVILFNTYLGAGRTVAALPDGRKALEVLTDSVGPAQGRDTTGPTAMLNSVAHLPLNLAVGTPVLNIRFQRNTMETDEQLARIAALIRGFFAKGGMQIQLSVLSRDQMLAAQRQPEKHQDLIVRIGGYSEKFVVLPRELQDSVIARTEHGA